MRVAAVVLILAAGCARDPVTAECPDIGPGDLVVTEIRGPQDPEDLNGPWVELFNASGGEIDLVGIKIRFRRKDGSSEVPVLVRHSVPLAAGGYAVLGDFADAEKPAFASYGFADDYRVTWLSAAAVDVESCGTLIDRAIYDVLPDVGTYSLGGAPDSENNDLPASWCTDPNSAGTPGAMNVACP
ncbi:MAG TPA: hypothetical protein VFQ53_33775 [Kofleriaceae bacterium]|nr:hypothetical protein [Kofleriaceae bacterium]